MGRLCACFLLGLALAACTSAESTLDIDQAQNAAQPVDPNQVPQAPADPALAPASAIAPAVANSAQALTNAATYRVYFAPIVGAPVDKVTALSRRLSSASGPNSITLQPSKSNTINHEIRGYFSALSENGSTTVIHVWDVFTPTGQRVHRIQGQERVSGENGDPWRAVPAPTMESIADAVLSQYASWRRGQTS